MNQKTRNRNPFFVHECKDYDGSVLALFLKDQNMDEHKLCASLNAVDWRDLGFVCGDRYIFNQKSLENIKLPWNFRYDVTAIPEGVYCYDSSGKCPYWKKIESGQRHCKYLDIKDTGDCCKICGINGENYA